MSNGRSWLDKALYEAIHHACGHVAFYLPFPTASRVVGGARHLNGRLYRDNEPYKCDSCNGLLRTTDDVFVIPRRGGPEAIRRENHAISVREGMRNSAKYQAHLARIAERRMARERKRRMAVPVSRLKTDGRFRGKSLWERICDGKP